MSQHATKKIPWLTVLWAGLLVGYLDISAAVFDFMFRNDKVSPIVIFRYIAGAALGKEHNLSASSMIALGILFHFLIAYAFTIFFFFIYPRLSFFGRYPLVDGIVYGLFIWCVMNLVVVPLSSIGRFPVMNAKAGLQMLILIVTIGIPLSFIAKPPVPRWGNLEV